MTSPFSTASRVVVSGGGRGIGAAVTRHFAATGASVHIISSSDAGAQLAQELTGQGARVAAHAGSVADEQFCRDVIAGIETSEGGVDVLVNAAGILGPHGRFAEIDMTGFAEAVTVNLLGTCNLIRWTLPGMEARGFGRIVNFAGGGAAYAYPLFTPYAASKVAVVRLTETIAEEITTPNVTINVIAPGAVDTDMLKEVRRRGGEVRTTVSIDEPVSLVSYLASAEAGHINGRFLHVRDSYRDASLFESKDMLKLRRTERR